MSAVEFKHDRRQVILPVAIINPTNPTRFHRTNGLVDTGATISGVARTVAESVDLPRRGKQTINTPTGLNVVRMYRTSIGLFPANQGIDTSALMPFVLPLELIAIECSPSAFFEVLIGMDVLGRCDFFLRRNGTGSLAWPNS